MSKRTIGSVPCTRAARSWRVREQCFTFADGLDLAEKYGDGTFNGKTPEERAEVNQILALQLSGVGPAQGQVNWFKVRLSSCRF